MPQENIRVLARVRPSKKGETEAALLIDNNIISAFLTGRCPAEFTFDHVFGPSSRQEEVFEQLGREIVDGVLSGINGTVFAYGQTGSGKTHTMIGQLSNNELPTQEKGLIPRCLEYLFSTLETRQTKESESKVSITCSFIELYNEVLTDLLSKNGSTVTIRGNESKMKLQGAKVEPITTVLDALKLLRSGFTNRQIAETAMNKESSRSHAIFIVDVSVETGNSGLLRRSSARLNFVDLAGSERQSSTGCQGIRLKEAGKINQSLSILGRVIRKLSDASPHNHVPYRDSRLTLMLRDSLGGNSRTAVVVNLHPDTEYLADSLSTLQFAEMCGKIRNTTTVNREIAGESVTALKGELLRLTQELEDYRSSAEKEASIKAKTIIDDLEAWKKRALEGQESLASLRVELDFQMRLSRTPLTENEAMTLEELKEEVVSVFRSALEDYDSATAAGEFHLLKSQLFDSRKQVEELRQKLRQANDTHRLTSLSQSPSPAVRLGSRLSQLAITSPPLEFSSSRIHQTPFVCEASSEEIEGSSQFKMVSIESWTELTEMNALLEQDAEEQKKAMEEFKQKFTQREHDHTRELTAAFNEAADLKAEVVRLAAEVKKLSAARTSLEEQRSVLEQRLAVVSIERDSYASELRVAQVGIDEWTEKCQMLENQLEEKKIHLEKAQIDIQNASLDIVDIRQSRTIDQGVQVGGQIAIDGLKNRLEELSVDNWHKEMTLKQLEDDFNDQKAVLDNANRLVEEQQLKMDKLVESNGKEIERITMKGAADMAKAKKEKRRLEKALEELRKERNTLKRRLDRLESPESEKENSICPDGYEFSQKTDELRESFAQSQMCKKAMDDLIREKRIQGTQLLMEDFKKKRATLNLPSQLTNTSKK